MLTKSAPWRKPLSRMKTLPQSHLNSLGSMILVLSGSCLWHHPDLRRIKEPTNEQNILSCVHCRFNAYSVGTGPFSPFTFYPSPFIFFYFKPLILFHHLSQEPNAQRLAPILSDMSNLLPIEIRIFFPLLEPYE